MAKEKAGCNRRTGSGHRHGTLIGCVLKERQVISWGSQLFFLSFFVQWFLSPFLVC